MVVEVLCVYGELICGGVFFDFMVFNVLINSFVKEEKFEVVIDVVCFINKYRIGDDVYVYERFVDFLCKMY